MDKFWKIENAVDHSGSTLYLEGPISDESWYGDETTPQAFRAELKELNTNKLTVVLNSGGGDVWAGLAIYNELRELDAEIVIRVDGLAASIASVIAMAGDKIIMSPGSMMMIHKPSTIVAGNEGDLMKAIEILQTTENSIVPIYENKTGLAKEKIVEMLEAETWMTAEEAVSLGFATELVNNDSSSQPAMSFGRSFALSMSASKSSIDDFVKKFNAKNEVEDEESPDTDLDENIENQEQDSPANKTEVQGEVEPTATENINKPTEEKGNMHENNVNDIAQTQVVNIAPQDLAGVDKTTKIKDYLKSKESLTDFANVLAENAGRDAKDVRAAWKKHVAVKNDITNPEILLPEGVIRSIQDAFAEGGEIWNLVNKTNLDVFRVAWDTVVGEDSRAKGHKRGTTKQEEVITLDDRTIRAQFIYKYLTLDKETVRENRGSGALLNYVLSELPKRIVREIERAIVIGDGRPGSDEQHIYSFVSIKEDAAANNTFASTYTPVAGESRYETILKSLDGIKAGGPVYLVASKGYLTDLKLERTAGDNFMFMPGTNFADVFNLAGIITPDWMTEDTANDAYLVVFGEYRTVGDTSIEAFSNFILKENKNEYLQEVYTGGALTAMKSAMAIAKAPEA